MKIYKWEKDLEIGIELIDEQHKTIIERTNTFFIRHKNGENPESIIECLEFLQNYIMYHFHFEETYMSECSYPAYRDHQAKHKWLATQVKFFAVKLTASNFSSPDVLEFYSFVTSWIEEHILREDFSFASYYKDHLAEQ